MTRTAAPLVAALAAGVLLLQAAPVETAPASRSPSATAAGELLDRAEELVREGSYGLAREAYVDLAARDLAAEQRRWVEFRLADTLWRTQPAWASDPTELFRARDRLEELARATTRESDRDRTWAEIEESLGDLHWTRRAQRDWGRAWTHYRLALDYWAASREIDLARERFLGIARRAARPPEVEPYYVYGSYGNQLPQEVLLDVLRIAVDPDDRAWAHYLLAMNLRWQGGPQASRRVAESFEQALAAGRETDWYDDALYHYAEWRGRAGRVVPVEGGGWRQEPDYSGALELFRRLADEFREGETRYRDDALRQIESITGVQLGLAVSNAFLPGSIVEYQLSWRNTARVDLALWAVDLTRDVRFAEQAGSHEWLQQIDLAGGRPERRWSWATNDRGDHEPGQETLEIEGRLAPGAYVLEARTGERTARDLVLVTDLAVLVKTSGRRALVWATAASDGSPRAAARVRVWIRSHDGKRWSWSPLAGTTDETGLASFELPAAASHLELFVACAADGHQAFAATSARAYRGAHEDWRVYALTDRPAYRPGERVSWKVVARRDRDGSGYSTPGGERLGWEIGDPRGGKLAEGTLELNTFGSAWGEAEPGEAAPLGEYRVTFRDAGGRTIGGAVLFRLEEYKLPEFRVEVRAAQADDGGPRTLRAGETLEAEVRAEYYFGGPVAGARVEVSIARRPFRLGWSPPREFPWFYEDMQPRPVPWGAGEVVHRESLATDAAGRAVVRFDTAADAGTDFEYTIEARVSDASRREVVGRGTVRASRQRYFAFLRPGHNLYRPGDRVELELRTVDADERPLAAEGRLRVTRDRWVEIWVDPEGREVRGDELERRRRPGSRLPAPGGPGWWLERRGYEQEELLSRLVRTGEDGLAQVEFAPPDAGYYRASWVGDELEPFPVRAETTVWVGDADTTRLGYRPGGVQILVDDDTVRPGGRLPVMLSAPLPDSWVLLTVEAEELIEARVVHLPGTARFLELEVGEAFVPNVFLEAALVREGELFVDTRQVVVPPVEHFLEVELEPDREEYAPRAAGTLTVRTRDHLGRPVPAEVSLALVDDSVFYIQEDYAGDPRRFFFGRKRAKSVVLRSSFHEKRYVELGRDARGASFDRLRADDEDRRGPGAPSPAVGREGYDIEAGAGFRERSSGVLALKRGVADMAEVALEAAAAPASAAADEVTGGAGAVQVRTDFRATALWRPDVVTGADGTAQASFDLPDSLTTWRATARAASTGSQFGTAAATARTTKPLIVRLQAPRFFVVGDRATISAVVNNNTAGPLEVSAELQATGLAPVGRGDAARLSVPAGGETRFDWVVAARAAGEAVLQVAARGGDHADAMERRYAVHEHGIDKLLARSGKLRGAEARVAIELPAARRPGSTSLVVQLTPSLAVTLLDALPYLIDYPYGCTEQTMSRFLPAAIVARTLERLGLERADVAGRIFGGVERAHAGRTHPQGERDLAELERMVRAGLDRLADFQHADGGWGWWKEGDSDEFMTAYVVWGLGLAREAGVRVDPALLKRGAEHLDRRLVEAEEDADLQAWMLHALASLRRGADRGAPSAFQRKAFDNLWQRREGLAAYGRALLALSAHDLGESERAATLVRNLANGVVRDRAPDRSVLISGASPADATVQGTAHWGEDGRWWRWRDGPVESTAFVLRALLAIDPSNELVEPATTWLIRNRRGAQWSNTRDTAIAVLALGDYLEASGELETELEVALGVNGREVARQRVGPSELLAAPSRFEIDPAWLRDGANEIRVTRTGGEGALYFSAEARFFSLEEPVQPAGNELFVERSYRRIVPQPTLLRGYVLDKLPLDDGATVASGDRVEVVLQIETKNDYEYLVFEDLKPAGLEAVGVRSGEPLQARELSAAGRERLGGERDPADYTGRSRSVYQELRDRKVALFLDRLPQGVWEIRYELRAEVPGEFHALPALGHAMYVPEIRGNASELRLSVTD